MAAHPSTRLTLAKNSQRTVRTVVVLQLHPNSPDSTIASILDIARNKLRLKKPCRIFLDDGSEITPHHGLSRICNDTLLLISSGEPFVGSDSSSLPSLSKADASSEDEHKTEASVNVIGSDAFVSDYVEPLAVAQLKATARLSGIVRAVGMPDLHPGDRYPIGAVFESVGCIYPALIGGDVGCGMALFQTSLSTSTNAKRICEKLHGLEGSWKEGSPEQWLSDNVEEIVEGLPAFYEQLGTIGGGNHFAEIQQVDRITDMATFTDCGLKEHKLVLLVHSGSRALGPHIGSNFPSKLIEGTSDFDEYLKQHHFACSWAKANRGLIAHRILTALGTEGADKVLDIWHNNVTKQNISDVNGDHVWIHRKGAAPSDRGPIVIPGSRGALSYLVVPVGGQRGNSYSTAHGAGRRLTRSMALNKMQHKASSIHASVALLEETPFHGKVICEDADLLFEEAPEAYKDIEAVLAELENYGLVKVVATYKPVVTYKKRVQDYY